LTQKEIELIPVPGTKTEVGVYEDDLNKIAAKEGDWVGVKYGGKRTSVKVKRVEKRPGWQDNIIWIHRTQRTKLGLPDIVESSTPTNPPANIKVIVWKHSFPREPRVYLAFSTFILGVFTACLSFVKAVSPEQASFIAPIQFLLALGTAIVGLITTMFQKQ